MTKSNSASRPQSTTEGVRNSSRLWKQKPRGMLFAGLPTGACLATCRIHTAQAHLPMKWHRPQWAGSSASINNQDNPLQACPWGNLVTWLRSQTTLRCVKLTPYMHQDTTVGHSCSLRPVWRYSETLPPPISTTTAAKAAALQSLTQPITSQTEEVSNQPKYKPRRSTELASLQSSSCYHRDCLKAWFIAIYTKVKYHLAHIGNSSFINEVI